MRVHSYHTKVTALELAILLKSEFRSQTNNISHSVDLLACYKLLLQKGIQYWI